MLTKQDIKTVQNLIAESLADFFHGTLAPYLEEKFKQNDDEHKKIFKMLDKNDKDHDRIFRKLEQNQDGHDEMFQRLDRIEGHVKNHEKRIKRLETVTAS